MTVRKVSVAVRIVVIVLPLPVGDRGEIRYLEVLKYQLFGMEFECDTTVARVHLFCSILYFYTLLFTL